MKKPEVVSELEVKKKHLKFRVLAYRKLTDDEMNGLYKTWDEQRDKHQPLKKNQTVQITSIIGYHNE